MGSWQKFMTKAIENRFAKVGRQEGPDQKVIAKWFDPTSQWTWYATEYYPESKTFYGFVVGFEEELGYFSREELENAKLKWGLKIERDQYWREVSLSKVMSGEVR